jgi:hypothetical protein
VRSGLSRRSNVIARPSRRAHQPLLQRSVDATGYH